MRSMATDRFHIGQFQIGQFQIGRRKFLAGAAGGALASLLARRAGAGTKTPAAAIERANLVGAARIGGVDGGALWCRDGVCDFALPARAHAAVALPASGEVMLVGRRPGRFAAIFDPARPEQGTPRLIAPVAAHRFTGHAALAGERLVTSELHEDTSEALIGLRDPRSGALRDSWQVTGIEPHDLLFADGGARLVVALGGIAKPADAKSPPLNLGHIESSIVELDARSGRLLKGHALEPALHSLSLRHMALAPDGETIVFGMQDQDRSALRPLAGVLRVGRGIELLPLPSDDPGALRFYIGSVAVDSSGRFAAATSPKGGALAVWSLTSGSFVGLMHIDDVCGLAAGREAGTFWATSGGGDVVLVQASEAGLASRAHWRADAAFDNHLLRI
jgi:hypothetical protein